MLARPDFLLWTLPALVYLAVSDRSSPTPRVFPRAALLGGAIVAPWVVFTSLYYGSPVPHTIVAKAAGYASTPSLHSSAGTWLSYLAHQPAKARIWQDFAPFFDDLGTRSAPGGQLWIKCFVVILWALAAAGIWRTWRSPRWRPMVAFAALYFLYILFGGSVDLFEWYLAPFQAVVVILAAVGLTGLARVAPRPLAIALAIALTCGYVVQDPYMFPMQRKVQAIENHVREPLGKYLARVVRPGQSVASESAGYLGYYGHVKLYDYPGLTSPTALAAVRAIPVGHRDFPRMAVALMPQWIVARPFEIAEMLRIDPGFTKQYVASARVTMPSGTGVLRVGGLRWWSIDRDFWVLRRSSG